MAGTQQTINSQSQIDQNNAADIMFRIRCAIPAIVQSYNPYQNTIEAQPAIRERLVLEDGSIQYLNLPLLINVPVAFPSSGSASITFPISKGDECLVIFSDLAIDNFWTSGSIQNPVEVRRHDLSDGIAIPCSLSLTRARSAGGSIQIRRGDTLIEVGASTSKMSSGDRVVELTDSGARIAVGENYAAVNSSGVVLKGGSSTITLRDGVMNFSVDGKVFTGTQIYDKLQE